MAHFLQIAHSALVLSQGLVGALGVGGALKALAGWLAEVSPPRRAA